MSPPILRTDVPLAPFTTFGLPARARRYVEVDSLAALQALRETPAWRDERRLVLGGGSNVVFTGDFDGLVVRIASRGLWHEGDDGTSHVVVAEAGEDWDGVVRRTVEAGWPGLENLAAIPGTVGASPVQNIGAYGIELAERFAWLDAVDADSGAVTRMTASDCRFGYRDSVFKGPLADRAIIVRVAFALPLRWSARRGYADVDAALAAAAIDRPTATQMIDVVTAIRRAKLPDPALVGNAGSFFKNPRIDGPAFDALRGREPAVVGHREPDGRVKVAAGWLIDRAGWRGRTLPGNDRVGVHDRQALVLVDRGGATGRDVLALAAAIRDDIATRFGIRLEIEPRVV